MANGEATENMRVRGLMKRKNWKMTLGPRQPQPGSPISRQSALGRGSEGGVLVWAEGMGSCVPCFRDVGCCRPLVLFSSLSPLLCLSVHWGVWLQFPVRCIQVVTPRREDRRDKPAPVALPLALSPQEWGTVHLHVALVWASCLGRDTFPCLLLLPRPR